MSVPLSIGRCPACSRASQLDPSNAFRPFCSERCKLLDLGDWMNGRFAIPVVDSEPDDDYQSDPGADQ